MHSICCCLGSLSKCLLCLDRSRYTCKDKLRFVVFLLFFFQWLDFLFFFLFFFNYWWYTCKIYFVLLPLDAKRDHPMYRIRVACQVMLTIASSACCCSYSYMLLDGTLITPNSNKCRQVAWELFQVILFIFRILLCYKYL